MVCLVVGLVFRPRIFPGVCQGFAGGSPQELAWGSAMGLARVVPQSRPKGLPGDWLGFCLGFCPGIGPWVGRGVGLGLKVRPGVGLGNQL